MDKFGLKEGGPSAATCPETMADIVEGNGVGEAKLRMTVTTFQSDNRVVIDLIVERLLDKETMDGDEFREILSTYTILPNKNLHMYQNSINSLKYIAI